MKKIIKKVPKEWAFTIQIKKWHSLCIQFVVYLHSNKKEFMLQKISTLIGIVFSFALYAQPEQEVNPPYNIKTISFIQANQNVIPIFRLGDSFQFVFDDLYGDEANYYYTVTHCDYDWKKSQLNINEYIQGLDNQRIIDYQNSFNTLQLYSHYRISFPNQFTRGFKVSGNYMLKIWNNNQELVFSRKFILYEDLVAVPMQVRSARDVRVLNQKHNLEFTIKPNNLLLQNPVQNVKILLLKNGIWNTAITNIKPMFTIGNDLVYKYDKETQFWAGNEFLFFDNKDLRNAVNSIRSIDLKGIYNSYLFTNQARGAKDYTFFPDANGNFVVRSVQSREDVNTEADYAWVFFSLEAPSYFGKKDIYITGMFNNYALTPEYKMDFNKEKGIYEKALIIKQGFTNYQFTLADSKGIVDEANALDGNYFQTENNYFCMVYYRANNDRFDRVIGKGIANSTDIIK